MRYWSLLLLWIVLPVLARDGDVPPIDTTIFPTIAALEQAAPPFADRVDLARRFFGVTEIPVPPTNAPVYALGDIETFRVSTTQSGMTETTQAQLRAIGDHVLVWIDLGATFVTDTQAQQFAQRFDTEVYEFTRGLWGSEMNPGVDGDLRLYVLFTPRLRRDLAGVIFPHNSLPRALMPESNERELILFNSLALGGAIENDNFISVAAHEFQHLIRANIDPDEDEWMNEGLSMLTEHFIGISNSAWAYNTFLINPNIQLNSLGTGPSKNAEYGAGMLFLLYFHERYGSDATRLLSADSANGLQAVDNTLQTLGEPGVDVFFADWVLANAVRRADSGYGYQTLPVDAIPVTIDPVVLPDTIHRWLPQYSTAYIAVERPPQSLTITLTMPDSVAIVPTNSEPGDWFWYSNRGSNINPTLTRTFDLRDVPAATLRYRVWYDLEVDWDYGYISVSSDGGTTWQPQPTRYTVANNPNGKAYGVGYTGRSGDWLEDEVVLDSFAGQQIVVRFEVVTDDAIAFTGMALDDIRLNALGYASDANADDGGWQSNGWIRTDNRLPQRAWLQAIVFVGGNVVVSRWLTEGNSSVTLPIAAGADRVIVAFSPFGRLTLQSVNYFLTLE